MSPSHEFECSTSTYLAPKEYLKNVPICFYSFDDAEFNELIFKKIKEIFNAGCCDFFLL